MHGARLVVGLGNPGREYAGHRHNVGFRVAERLAGAVGIPLGQSRFQGRFGQGDVGRTRVLLLLPETFMNVSGEAVSAAARFYKVAPEDLLVIHDELDLSFGRLQLKKGGGTGGHNGLESIVEQLGTPDFARLRFGIGKPQGPNAKERVVGHVLHDFSSEEKEALPPLLDRAVDMARAWLSLGLAEAMNRHNRR
ncbi:MAG: aminoacyl-tRNA hydrolase [Myxococcaceae bacterium]|nr:MAG: aminoacyl-tRNA hydrolase [Myxococcaceae bacterium]